MDTLYDWTNFPKTKLYSDIISEWQMLLDNESLNELSYQSFLQKTPAIFLTASDSYLVVSKLKLGSDYETDFVIVEEGYSDGTIYEIIEIETPHIKLFDQKGKPSAKFNAALQQIRDWKRFLINNKNEFKRIFPTVSTKVIKDSRLKFKMVIGRRTENLEYLEKRRQIAELENIEIISFDRLTDLAKSRRHFSDIPEFYAAQMDSVSYALKNELANPFYKCMSDSEWRSICKKGHSHIYTNMINDIVNIRTYSDYFEVYKKLSPTFQLAERRM
ncbi:MAG: DUF4263 domain-containing protein [Chitinophagaceae bacterium]|nr:DUF4263 domain-containing protein [Chitinophagaceae bacterium]